MGEQAFYPWKKEYGGLAVNEIGRLKQLEEEHRQSGPQRCEPRLEAPVATLLDVNIEFLPDILVVCGELLIFETNQQFATRTSKLALKKRAVAARLMRAG